MLKRYHQGFGLLFRLLDVSVVVAAWLTAFPLRFSMGPFPVTKGIPAVATYVSLTPLVAVLWFSVFSGMRVYESRRLLGRFSEIRFILKSHGVALLLFVAITYMFDEYKYSRLVTTYFAALSGVALVACRLALRTSLRNLRARGYNVRHVVAVGEGHVLESAIARLERFPEAGLRICGVLLPEGRDEKELFGKPVLGTYGGVVDVVRRAHADEVLITLPPSENREVDRLLDLLKDEMVDVRLVPDLHRYVTLGCEIGQLDGVPVVHINDSPLVGLGAYAKRVTDFLLAALALVVLFPVLAAIGLLVKLTSPGPMFYGQERLGLDGRRFTMYKFRSMKVDAESTTGPTWAKAVDDRRTALGTFLRKTSLDELPQLWNVLRGEMALVGPRPERPMFVDTFRHSIPHYMLRHKVKAGITGWAQVNGWRGDTSLARRIDCDLFYIKNWSYLLDLKILVMTVWKGFINKNAY